MDFAALPDTARQKFCHEPLDHSRPSIRLVRLSPDLSADGMIQCELIRETTEASYTCLSYRWGAPDSNASVIINGQVFVVRQNLLDFLDMARQHVAATNTYWIDALCIDQGNVSERNHQVAQMGDIYSRAACVYVWLGKANGTKDMAPALRILGDPESASPQQWGLISALKQDLEDYICRNPYWQRAWIIQEIFLARNVLVWLNTETIPFEFLHWTIDYFYLGWRELPIGRFNLSRRSVVDTKTLISGFENAKSLYHGASLQFLLNRFFGMNCERLRDRVFSLASLCRENHAFPVDYGSTNSDMFVAILKHCNASSCLCMPRLLAQSMGLYNNFDELEELNDGSEPYIEVEMPTLKFSDDLLIHHVDGKCFIVAKPVLWPAGFDGYELPVCESLDRLIEELSWLRFMVEVGSAFKGNIGHSNNDLGIIQIPSGYTLSSYIQEHGGMWLRNHPDEHIVTVSKFSVQKVDDTTCTYCIPLSALPESPLGRASFLGHARAACWKTIIHAGTLERINGDMKEDNWVKWRVRSGRWNHNSALIEHLYALHHFNASDQ